MYIIYFSFLKKTQNKQNERAQAKLEEVKGKVNEAYLKKFDMETVIYNMYVKVMAFKNRRKKR